MNCGNCGAPLQPGATSCTNCGAIIAMPTAVPVQPMQQMAQPVQPVAQPMQQMAQPVQPTQQVAQQSIANPVPLQSAESVLHVAEQVEELHMEKPVIYTPPEPVQEEDPKKKKKEKKKKEPKTPKAPKEPRKPINKKVLYIILVILLVGVGTGVGFFVGKSMGKSSAQKCAVEPKNDETKALEPKEEKTEEKNEENKSTDNENAIAPNLDLSNIDVHYEDDNDERSKNIEFIKAFYNYSGKKYSYAKVLLKNNNSEMVNVTVYLNYYKDGVRIGSFQQTQSNVKANREFIVSITATPIEEFDSIDMSISAKVANTYYIDVPVSKKELTINELSNYLQVLYTNNTDKKVSIYIGCKYYNKDELVYVYDGFIDVQPKASDEGKFYDSSLPSDLEYDKRDVFIYAAYSTSEKY